MTTEILAVEAADVVRAGQPGTDRTDWWRDAVIYQIYIRSFADADGDGVGDLAGIRSRLPYLADLGVDALWITPFFTSPMADFGYDVADYRAVDPVFGDLDDFRALLADAHARALRVIVDLVPNHTSDRHAWFVEALAAPAGSPARDRYIFREGRGAHGELPPNDWESVFGGPAWTRTTDPDGTPGQWYLHLFAPEQPDLNWDLEEVRAEFLDVLRFWLDLGVDGFRIDVAHGLVKAPGLPDVGRADHVEMIGNAVLPFFDQDGVHEIYRAWRLLLDSYPGGRIGAAEAWAPTPERLANYVRPDELHQAFNFDYLGQPFEAGALRAAIDHSLATAGSVGAPSTWVLSNHDMKRHVTRYGGGAAGRARARAAALLMLALPGSAYVYQGEELGLPEVLDIPVEFLVDPQGIQSGDPAKGRDGCRVPLPWSGAEPPFGFGPAGSTASWLPAPAAWSGLTVAAQTGDPDSVLELYRSALALRRQLPELGAETDGSRLTWLPSPGPVLMFRRGEEFVCTVNTGSDAVTLPVPGTLLLGSAPVAVAGGQLTLPADTAAWWRV
ncbi:glycoside hydrolase family 13 protein [Catenulispora yoronensis]|uniref:Glycoside hydrolase family 13 protein n=1 Tax=Catenulispora yoronensis TaxID=450799 RepID=A0ABN2TWP6_9ACTN